MLVQRTLTKNPRAEAWMELLELISGLFLALFIQAHILALSNILFGAAAFDHKSLQMDEYFVSHLAIFLVCVAILGHGLLAMRKAPWRVQEAQIVWRHSRLLNHDETWYWLVQIVTGLAVLVLAVDPHLQRPVRLAHPGDKKRCPCPVRRVYLLPDPHRHC